MRIKPHEESVWPQPGHWAIALALLMLLMLVVPVLAAFT